MEESETFLHNGWYVIAMSQEVTRDLLPRMVLNEPLVMYRTQAGVPVVLEDYCPHRLLPLSKGCVVGDGVQCGYHGMQFDPNGHCINIPGEERIPRDLKVRRYPVVEKHRWIYAWMGKPELADPKLIPEYADPTESAGWHHVSGLFPARCNYLLILDNIMDLSHLAFVHAGSVGDASIADKAVVETSTQGDRVRVVRRTCNVPAASTYAHFGKYRGNIDRWQVTEYAPPAFFLVNNGSKPTAPTPPSEGDVSGNGMWGFQVYHAITPETENTSHDFWTIGAPVEMLPADAREKFKNTMEGILDEDRGVYDAQQKAVEAKSPLGRAGRVQSRIALKGDKALVAARRVLQTKINADRRGVAGK
jgi:phenylpropionate dioxygenase-like ring-hydroxylating dioxygenase large terminal subunit